MPFATLFWMHVERAPLGLVYGCSLDGLKSKLRSWSAFRCAWKPLSASLISSCAPIGHQSQTHSEPLGGFRLLRSLGLLLYCGARLLVCMSVLCYTARLVKPPLCAIEYYRATL